MCLIRTLYSVVILCILPFSTTGNQTLSNHGYVFINETQSLYNFHQERRNWQEAVDQCAAEGATLFFPSNKCEADAVISRWRETPAYGWAYIGVTRLNESHFATINGQSILDVYHNWYLGEPNNENSEENCVVILRDGTLNDVRCNLNFPFICKIKDESKTYPAICDESTRNEDTYAKIRDDYVYLEDTNNFYKIHYSHSSWQDAKVICQKEGTVLFYPKNRCEADVVLDLWNQTQSFNKLFVGISKSSEETFITLDGIPVYDVYNQWAQGEPNNAKEDENCVILLYDGIYKDVECNNTFPFICKKEVFPENVTAACNDVQIDEGPETKFRNDYKYFEDSHSFYKIHTITKAWEDAKVICENEGASLFYAKNECEAKLLLNFWNQRQPFDSAYVGISNPSMEISGGIVNYVTIDDKPAYNFYNIWSQGEPSNINGDKNCVVLLRVGTLSSERCEKKQSFICRKEVQINNTYCDNANKPKKFQKDYSYINETQSFYKIHTKSKDWYQAMETCKEENSFLFYPENQCEADLILDFWSKKQLNSRIHVGISQLNGAADFRIIDDRSINEVPVFLKWRLGEPNFSQREERCVAMHRDGGTLEDVQCDIILPFICKKQTTPRKSGFGCDVPKKGISTPTTLPSDYTYIEETQSFYKVHTIKEDWYSAKRRCVDEGAIFFYAENECELDVMLEFLRKTQTPNVKALTVGIRKWAAVEYYENIDGQKNFYTKWDASAKREKECVVLSRTSGAYSDIDCNGANYFICKKKAQLKNKDYLCYEKNGTDESSDIRFNYVFSNETRRLYKLHTQPRNWQEANKMCAQEYASLFYANNHCEAQNVLNLLRKNQFVRSISIGISCSKEGLFETVDNKPLWDVYSNWRPGEPNNENEEENCVILNQDQSMSDVNCDRRFSFVCVKKYQDKNNEEKSFCDQPETGKLSTAFRKDYTYFNNTQKFYKIHTIPQNWQKAAYTCGSEGASLFYPKNKCEADNILDFWNQTQLFESILVGISKRINTKFETINGQPVWEVYNQWRAGEPSYKNGNEDCVALSRDGTLESVRCDRAYPFVCEKKAEVDYDIAECDLAIKNVKQNFGFRMDYAYLKDTRSFYKIHSIMEPWTNAKDTCEQEDAKLFYPENEHETTIVLNLWKNTQPFNKVYVGIYNPTKANVTNVNSFVTIDGRPMSDIYNKWEENKPSHIDLEGYCVVLNREGLYRGDRCGNRLSFICKTTFTDVITMAISGRVAKYDEPGLHDKTRDYTFFEDTQSSYKFHTAFETWDMAKERCEKEGAALFYPENKCEANVLLKLWNETQFFRRAFIGISSPSKGTFKTVHGASIWLIYDNWLPGEPNNLSGEENCVVMYRNGTLNDDHCKLKIPFICKKKFFSDKEHKCGKQEIDETRFIERDYTYIKDTQSLYKIHTIPETWRTAQKTCNEEAGILFYPENDCESTAVTIFWKETQPFDSMYVGLSSQINGKFETVDGRAIQKVYNKWRSDKPDKTDSKICVLMYRSDGLFDKDICNKTLPFICKRQMVVAKGQAQCDKIKNNVVINKIK